MKSALKLMVKNSSGMKFTLDIHPNETFADLKRRVEIESGVSLDFRDITANNSQTINEHQNVVSYFSGGMDGGGGSLGGGGVFDQVQEVVCAVPSCGNKKSKNPDKSFFDFPDEEIRCHQWVLYCRRIAAEISSNAANATKFPISPSSSTQTAAHLARISQTDNIAGPGSAICSDHFKADQFVKNTTSLLKRTAVPSINPEMPASVVGFASPGASRPLTSSSPPVGKITPSAATRTSSFKPQRTTRPIDALYLCRMCAKPSRNTVFIYSAEGQKLQLAEKINTNLPIQVKMTDFLPKQICQSCIKSLNHSHRLIEKAVETDSKLKEKFKTRKEKQNLTEHCLLCLKGQLKIVLEPEPPASTPSSHQENGVAAKVVSSNVEEEDEDDGQLLEEVDDTADDEIYSCRLCGLELLELGPALEHAISHSDAGLFQCSVCENAYVSTEELAEHFNCHRPGYSADRDFTCFKCCSSFKTESLLYDHACTEVTLFPTVPSSTRPSVSPPRSSPLNHRCTICYKFFPTEILLDVHTKFHTDAAAAGTPLPCDYCSSKFDDETKMYEHVRLEHPFLTKLPQTSSYDSSQVDRQMAFPCDICGKSFPKKAQLRNHMSAAHFFRTNKGEKPCFSCKICFETFPSTGHAVVHMESSHSDSTQDQTSYSFEMMNLFKLLICEYCEKIYGEAVALNKHRDTVHLSSSIDDIKVDSFECKWCKKGFPTYESMSDHKLGHSATDDVPSEYTGDASHLPVYFLCQFCDRPFMNYMKYTEHTTIHFGHEPFLCRTCLSRFKTLDEVIAHRKTHGNVEPVEDYDSNRPHECHYCDKSFAIEDALTKHIRMHTGEKPFTCNICGKGFSQSSGLNTHKKVHSEERPFKCVICPRSFKIKGDRDVHIRKHSGERPFKCEFCFKAFMTQHVYSQHKKIHTGERPYKCDVCHVAFRRSHVLTVHKRIHTGEKPNVCDVCGKRYRQKGDMLKHKRSVHGGQSTGSALFPLTSVSTQSVTDLTLMPTPQADAFVSTEVPIISADTLRDAQILFDC